MASKKDRQDELKKDKTKPAASGYDKVAPRSIEGVEASDLPDGGRGDVDTDPRKVSDRKPPNKTGENTTGDVGLRGTPDIADADDHGGRKRN